MYRLVIALSALCRKWRQKSLPLFFCLGSAHVLVHWGLKYGFRVLAMQRNGWQLLLKRFARASLLNRCEVDTHRGVRCVPREEPFTSAPINCSLNAHLPTMIIAGRQGHQTHHRNPCKMQKLEEFTMTSLFGYLSLVLAKIGHRARPIFADFCTQTACQNTQCGSASTYG